MLGRTSERYGPVALALALTCGWVALDGPFPSNPDALFGAAATVASVFASFLGVAKAIILTIKGTPAYAALKRSGYVNDLFDYLVSGVRTAILFAALSISGFFVYVLPVGKELYGIDVREVYSGFWVFSGFWALFSYARIGNILFKLLRQEGLSGEAGASNRLDLADSPEDRQ